MSGLFILPKGFGKKPRKRAAGQRNSHEEDDLQAAVAGFLDWALKDTGATWTAVAHGVYFTRDQEENKRRGMRLKRLGLKSGWPDVQIIYRGRYYGIELKTQTGALSTAQKAVHTDIVLAGATVTVCRSVDAVRDQLEVWGIPTRTEKPSAQRLREAGERLAQREMQDAALPK